jgi:hypothetical protein
LYLAIPSETAGTVPVPTVVCAGVDGFCPALCATEGAAEPRAKTTASKIAVSGRTNCFIMCVFPLKEMSRGTQNHQTESLALIKTLAAGNLFQEIGRKDAPPVERVI